MPECSVCGNTENLLLCGDCQSVYYCSKEHQKYNWEQHQTICKLMKYKMTQPSLWKEVDMNTLMGDEQLSGKNQNFMSLEDYIKNCMNKYGICVLDNFLGDDFCNKMFSEIGILKNEGRFSNGQLANLAQTSEKIRGDSICWLEKDKTFPAISNFISKMDSTILNCFSQFHNFKIGGRTKSMIACYPGDGTGYKRHIDNPNHDGRLVTSIYYLNKDWDPKIHGGLIRIYPTLFNQVAEICPKWDRLLLFWSDKRNPHEVLPAFRERYAITLWYFDAEERANAKKKLQQMKM